ncbi:hypothetical protein K523DRAFT_340888 [Schizophyllum commune Tattone D]|nr:hypothetical protein K523DRAFT_340888 [Schizophyllum commune Tattone D]
MSVYKFRDISSRMVDAADELTVVVAEFATFLLISTACNSVKVIPRRPSRTASVKTFPPSRTENEDCRPMPRIGQKLTMILFVQPSFVTRLTQYLVCVVPAGTAFPERALTDLACFVLNNRHLMDDQQLKIIVVARGIDTDSLDNRLSRILDECAMAFEASDPAHEHTALGRLTCQGIKPLLRFVFSARGFKSAQDLASALGMGHCKDGYRAGGGNVQRRASRASTRSSKRGRQFFARRDEYDLHGAYFVDENGLIMDIQHCAAEQCDWRRGLTALGFVNLV